jgi:antitoxin HicB
VTELQYPILVNKVSEENGGGYIAHAIDLNGFVGDGKTPEEAIADIRGAIVEWLDEAHRLQRPVPQPGEVIAKTHKKQQDLKDAFRVLQQSLEALLLDLMKDESAKIAALKELIAELADKSWQEPIWSVPDDVGLITGKKVRRGNDRIPHS